MRIDGKGRAIDRSQPLEFSFDGVRHNGFVGDTLASALMASGRKLFGRSFKYHRPRGVFTAGSEEPNALVTIGGEPNIRATTQELYSGLCAFSQNCWPSLGFDLLAVNDLAAPFLGAGFYYKTFMWPPAFWEKLYEPLIRRSAGLGALAPEASAESHEKAFAFCDVLVIGGGPAGLMAAKAAAQSGADVILCDEGPALGGRLLCEEEEIDAGSATDWVTEITAELAAMETVRIMTRTTVTGAYDHGSFGAVEQVSAHLADPGALPRSCFWRIAAKEAVLCAGALERPVAFAGNDLPGVMLAGAMRTYLNRWGVAPGRSIAVFCNNDDAHRTARDLVNAGVHVAALIDSRADAVNLAGDVPFYPGYLVARGSGRGELRAITLRAPGGTETQLHVDALGVSGGWNPAVHLTCHHNGRPVWQEDIAAFVPKPDAVPGLHPAGAASGDFGTAACLSGGAEAGLAAAERLGLPRRPFDIPQAENRAYRLEPLWSVNGKGRAWLDLQNDVTTKDVTQAARENYRSVEHMKRYTTQGMAPDQGKTSNVGALALLADVTGRTIPETGTTTFRPPYVPVSIAAMGAGAERKGFAPTRLTPCHDICRERAAPMVEAGIWYRPSYFPQDGETNWRQACDREVGMVRGTVGICDVSTLGKIELQGPDVGAFLNLVYANRFDTLAPGKMRYGIMLREDGHIMDDGTTARLDAQRWVMTTTTAAADQVVRHLDWVQQAFAPKLRLRFASVTDRWAQFSIAGPRSRDVLNRLLDTPLSARDFAFMACGPVSVGGVAARLFRVSFSGEHGYELAVPARFGASLFEALLDEAKRCDGGAYGVEALNVLRLEKGFVTHAEIDGRVTACDIGADGMISRHKDCIGKAMAMREGLTDPLRPQLVGLRPVAAMQQITAGSHLFAPGAEAVSAQDQGYVTSAVFSPTLDETRALGFLRAGRSRHGELVRAIDHMRGTATLCEVVDPVGFDPEGGRMRG